VSFGLANVCNKTRRFVTTNTTAEQGTGVHSGSQSALFPQNLSRIQVKLLLLTVHKIAGPSYV